MRKVKSSRHPPLKSPTGQRAKSKTEPKKKARLSRRTTQKAAEITRIHSE